MKPVKEKDSIIELYLQKSDCDWNLKNKSIISNWERALRNEDESSLTLSGVVATAIRYWPSLHFHRNGIERRWNDGGCVAPTTKKTGCLWLRLRAMVFGRGLRFFVFLSMTVSRHMFYSRGNIVILTYGKYSLRDSNSQNKNILNF